MDYKDLGARIRLIRRQKSLTQEELAERAGISASFLGHIERGTRIASLETLVVLCNTLGITPDYLLSSSLTVNDTESIAGMSDSDRARLSEFLRLAKDTVRNWDK